MNVFALARKIKCHKTDAAIPAKIQRYNNITVHFT